MQTPPLPHYYYLIPENDPNLGNCDSLHGKLTMQVFARVKRRSRWELSHWGLPAVAKRRKIVICAEDFQVNTFLRVSAVGPLSFEDESPLIKYNEMQEHITDPKPTEFKLRTFLFEPGDTRPLEFILIPEPTGYGEIHLEVYLSNPICSGWFTFRKWSIQVKNHKYETTQKAQHEHALQDDGSFTRYVASSPFIPVLTEEQ